MRYKRNGWMDKNGMRFVVNPIMSETSGEDGDHGLHGFGLVLLGA